MPVISDACRALWDLRPTLDLGDWRHHRHKPRSAGPCHSFGRNDMEWHRAYRRTASISYVTIFQEESPLVHCPFPWCDRGMLWKREVYMHRILKITANCGPKLFRGSHGIMQEHSLFSDCPEYERPIIFITAHKVRDRLTKLLRVWIDLVTPGNIAVCARLKTYSSIMSGYRLLVKSVEKLLNFWKPHSMWRPEGLISLNYRYVSSINISTERILQAKAQLSCGSDAQERRPRLSKATVATKGLAFKQVANWRNKCIKPILSYPYDIHILYTYILLFLLDV